LETGTPPNRHWYVAPPPEACAEKVAVWPSSMVTSEGCWLKEGPVPRVPASGPPVVPRPQALPASTK
jgi:hypothetical protein